ncbi:hypothetical protein F0562_002902 [Nyssa sinensis]|uniref:Mei2-like C-terminal RNA recognition motif domain-containing protein n=1 Tax=Nyssa sinensis TaxID=561372 RepID=A0A5J5BTU2_9ASTE|nr:hypothetical protein F0562_002902 [Nyssa sinensis]
MNPDAPSFYLETNSKISHNLKLTHHFYHHPPPLPSGSEHWPASPHFLQSHCPLYLQPVYFCKPPHMYDQYSIECQPQSFYPQAHIPLVHGGIGDCGVAAGDGGGAAKAVENEGDVKRVMGMNRFGRTRFMRRRREPILRCNGKTHLREWRQKSNKSQYDASGGVHLPPPQQLPPLRSPSPSVDVSLCEKTTIMIRNIPNQYRRNMLLDFLDKHCQEQNEKATLRSDTLHFAYDFVYLPMDFRTGDNRGYAFVNFTTTAAATKFRGVLDKYKWGVFKTNQSCVYESKKICEITWARIQGQVELIKHFKNSEFPCNNMEYLPISLSPARNGSTSLSIPTTVGKCLVSVPLKPLNI